MSPDYHLIGTYTRYSSWTARVETVLEYFEIPYTSKILTFDEIKAHSPSGLVPVLHSAPLSITIIDSLSILEFLAEQNPHLPLWPRDPALRALARSSTAEMHSGFPTLRNTFHTNFIARYEGPIAASRSEGAKREIKRLLRIWDDARRVTVERLGLVGESEDEGFLFGGFSIADAFYWPVLWRFRTYNLPLDDASPAVLKWMETMWNDPKLQKLVHWYYRQAENPETRIEKYENIFASEAMQASTFPEDWVFTAPGAA
ncbi:glutathione S-transferase [Aspergillus lucknowensis]|uniref:GST N-terminal domain-containing protein n=1 Tax=Aspergillus lucknowensis TaxID=176173 RepID=A0ABR4L880_9EURO